jgi:hypothetical protein
MADRPQDTIGGGGLILSLSIYHHVLRAVIWGRNDGGERGFWRISEEGREGKIKADPPKGRYVFVCTSFFVEALPKVRDRREILWRLVPRQVQGNCNLLCRLRRISGHSWSPVSMACVKSPHCQSDPA